ncbi:antitoxin Xre/MbcA/ParS toxin-binding domain-containing protein [Bosea sp. F3-2]|uniref:antitoxin Xre/MbcA/ParS toxin-binding domain-containing protein n=1 Tax=Bosea sp. F3-2 TaxID=2599640 RepID=UPI0016554C4B|nr:antitoxin Xre/MbcA/ParS toxin-binding domain-containing protein [Bosea sp. F3-2]
MTVMSEAEQHLMLRTALRILENWQVRDDDARRILGGVNRPTYAGWKVGVFDQVPDPILERVSALIAIHKGLRMMFSDPDRGYGWMSRPNQLFGEMTPLGMISQGEMDALTRLREYLETQSQPW